MQKKGFTLVELIVAMAIFGLLAVSALSLFSTSFRITQRAGHSDRAVAQASGEVDAKLANETAVTDGTTVTMTFENKDTSTMQAQTIQGTATSLEGRTLTITFLRPVPGELP